MSASKETPIKDQSDKLSQPFKAKVLREHIERAIIKQEFRIFHGKYSDLTQPKFELDVDPTSLKSCISNILAANKESDMYSPLAKLLTEISCIVRRMAAKERRTSAFSDKTSLIMFIPRSSVVQETDDGEGIRPDFAGVEATAEEVAEYLKDGSIPNRYSSLHWCHLLSVGEAKLKPSLVTKSDCIQLLSYVWCANRYQPNRFIHTALLAYKTGFSTILYRPDSAIISPTREYSDYKGLVQYVYDVYYPQCGVTTSQPPEFTYLKPIQNSSNMTKPKFGPKALKPTFTYSVLDGDKTVQYVIFDLFHGSGFGRQVYVGVGARQTPSGSSPQVIVLKVYCRERARRFREEEILQEIHKEGYVPGVPRICKNMVEQPFVLPAHRLDPEREACMIPLATTGESLSMCKDVLQFFKAMYDLTEVHRTLVERNVLHRDISWANILINHEHFEGPDENVHDSYFIENILKEPVPRVQVVLTDFDNAMLIQGTRREKDEHNRTESNKQCGITGTPAFIAEALAREGRPVEHFPFEDLKALNGVVGDHPQADRACSDEDFFEDFAGYPRLNEENVSHQAIHDAESIFWIIVFFMIRANPTGSDRLKSLRTRSDAFDAMMGHQIGNQAKSRGLQNYSLKNWQMVFPEELKRFSETLRSLSRYFVFPWYGIQVPDKHRFHAHNFLQRLLFHEITQLKKNPIPLELFPMPVQSELSGIQLTSALKSMPFWGPLKRSQAGEDIEEGEYTPAKRRKHEQSQADDDCTFSIADTAAAPIHSYQILPSIVQDNASRRIIRNIRTSIDIQKLWFTGNSKPEIVFQPLESQ